MFLALMVKSFIEQREAFKWFWQTGEAGAEI